MPRYSIDPNRFPGSILAAMPCKVFDATGAEVVECLLADTETGEVVCWRTDAAGELHQVNGEIETFTEHRPAPLRVVPLDEWEMVAPDAIVTERK